MKKKLLVIIPLTLLIILLSAFALFWFNPFNGDDIVIEAEYISNMGEIKTVNVIDVNYIYINRRGEYYLLYNIEKEKKDLDDIEEYLKTKKPDGRFADPFTMKSICKWLDNMEEVNKGDVIQMSVVDETDKKPDYINIHYMKKTIFTLKDMGDQTEISAYHKVEEDDKYVKKIIENWPIEISEEFWP